MSIRFRRSWAGSALLGSVILCSSGAASADDAPPPAEPKPATPKPESPKPEAGKEGEANAPAYAPSSKPDLIITAARTQEEIGKTPQAIGVVTQAEIERQQPKTAFHMLREEPGVWLTQANETFRGPIIRGRQGDDLVYLRDGTRMISFQALDFPLGLIDRIEYIRGPGSVQYGSNSLGGVLNIITKRPDFYPDAPRFGGEAYARFGTVSFESTNYLNAWAASKYFNALAGATFQRIGDYVGPTDGRIPHSGGFRAFNAYVDVGFRPSKKHELRASYMFMRKNDQEFYGQSKTNPSGIINNHLDFENRDMFKLEYRADGLSEWLPEVKAWSYFQTNDRLANITTETAPDPMKMTAGSINQTDISVDQWYFSLGTQAVTPFKGPLPGRLVYGAEFRLEDIAQPRKLYTTDNGTGKVTEKVLAGAIPRSRYDVLGTFLLAELRPSNRLTFSGGLRFETTGFRSSPEAIDAIAPFTTQDLTVDKRWNSLVWSVGSVFSLSDEFSIAANVGTGFRVPTPFELVLTQVQGNVQGVSTIPSTTLEPVKSTTYEAGPRWVSKYLKTSFTGYYTKLEKLIGFVDTPLTIDIPGVGVVKTRRNENSLDGFIVGFETYAEARLPALPELSVFGNLTYTFGWDEQRDVPLRGIPPINGVAGVRWESQPRRWWTEAVVHVAARKTAIAPEEKGDQAFAKDPGLGAPNATTNPPLDPKFEIPGYAVLNLRGGVTVWRSGERNINVMAAINNVFNSSYRPAFASIKEAPGVGADLAVKAAF